MTDDLLPAELALPAGVPVPIPDDVLDRVGSGEITYQADAYELVDEREAEWVMRRLARLMRDINDHRAQRDAWKTRVDEWYDETAAPAERRVAYLEDTLKRYAVLRRLVDRKATVKLPSGEAWTRVNKEPRIVIDDEVELLGYLAKALTPEQWEAVVRTTQAVRVTELAKMVDVIGDNDPDAPFAAELLVLYGGERVPGVHAEPPATTSGVRPDCSGPALPA